MMNCKDCIYTECLLRTEEEFEICPVETAKRKYEESRKGETEE